jgi:hypothetical protein
MKYDGSHIAPQISSTGATHDHIPSRALSPEGSVESGGAKTGDPSRTMCSNVTTPRTQSGCWLHPMLSMTLRYGSIHLLVGLAFSDFCTPLRLLRSEVYVLPGAVSEPPAQRRHCPTAVGEGVLHVHHVTHAAMHALSFDLMLHLNNMQECWSFSGNV